MFFNKKRPFQRVEYITILITLALLVFGLLILKSSTNSYEAQASYMKGQYVATLLGLGAMFVLMFTPPKLFKKLDFLIYLLSVGLLVYTLVFGEEMYGSKSWVDIGGYVFQPAEFAKVGLIVSLSGFMNRAKDRFNDLPVLLILIILALIP
ncbi:MAG: FtsW/RodA/SpoVE family cell cycle protein, partial [Ezakiella massiliensis]